MTSANETQPAPAGNHRTTLRHPAVLGVQRKRAQNVQLRVADQITRFAGSMQFVYIHAALFAVWMLWLEKNPWPTLTLVVSLEAIFLSTFVMIGQNRQAEVSQAKADHDYRAQELELDHNTKITELIHQLTKEIHATVIAEGQPSRPAARLPEQGGSLEN
jgi:uncharacterized membrane protein